MRLARLVDRETRELGFTAKCGWPLSGAGLVTLRSSCRALLEAFSAAEAQGVRGGAVREISSRGHQPGILAVRPGRSLFAKRTETTLHSNAPVPTPNPSFHRTAFGGR